MGVYSTGPGIGSFCQSHLILEVTAPAGDEVRSMWSKQGAQENALICAFLTLILRSAGEQSRNNKRFTSLPVGFQLIASATLTHGPHVHVGGSEKEGGKWETPPKASCK